MQMSRRPVARGAPSSELTPNDLGRLPLGALAVMGAAVFTAIATEVLPVGLLPLMSQGLGVTQARIGLLVSTYAVAVAVASIPLAAFLMRWPARSVLVSLLLTYALSNAALAAATGYWVAFGARLLGGLSHAGFFSVVFSAAVDLVPRARAGRAVAVVSARNALSLALGVPLGTALGVAVGWRWAFVLASLVMLALAVTVAVVLPAGAPPAAAEGRLPVLAAIRQRRLLLFATMVVVLTVGHYTAYTYLTSLLSGAGVAQSSVSLVLFGYGAAGLLGLAAAGVTVDRHPRAALSAAVLLLASSLFVLGLFSDRLVVVVVAVALWGLGFGALPTLVQAVGLQATPRSRDAAPAVVNATFNIGIAAGGVIGGRELLVASPATLAFTGAALAALSLALLISVRTPSVAAPAGSGGAPAGQPPNASSTASDSTGQACAAQSSKARSDSATRPS